MKKVLISIAVLLLVFLIVFCIGKCKRVARTTEDLAPRLFQELNAPELAVSLSPRFFSPDGDGIDDELYMTISCKDESPISEWKLMVTEEGRPNIIFYELSGKGNPPGRIVWDGHSSKGELVQSAMDYPFSLTVKNVHELSTIHRGLISVDVLVKNEGNRFRVQVPSIVFSSGAGGFTGLNETTLASNDYILKRIANVLDKFNTYNVTVEGHANFTAETEEGRRLEQERELLPLSEQRAKFVVDYLVKLGVDRSRLTAVGIGGVRPVVRYEDQDNWWKNRRVEFILDK
jgi:hypothetical protein